LFLYVLSSVLSGRPDFQKPDNFGHL
jgi:hypothetical protein